MKIRLLIVGVFWTVISGWLFWKRINVFIDSELVFPSMVMSTIPSFSAFLLAGYAFKKQENLCKKILVIITPCFVSVLIYSEVFILAIAHS